MIMMGAGDRPNRLNGAAGARSSKPQLLMLLKPTVMRDRAYFIYLQIRLTFNRLQLPTENDDTYRESDEKRE